jgi:hypothetical protein
MSSTEPMPLAEGQQVTRTAGWQVIYSNIVALGIGELESDS